MSEMKKDWWGYLLQCADGSIYTGISTDPERRVREHSEGRGSKYVASRLPVRQWAARRIGKDRAEAQRLEAAWKTRTHAEKVSALNWMTVWAALSVNECISSHMCIVPVGCTP